MLRLKKLHLLVLRSFLGPFAAGFSVALFILVLQFLSHYQDDIFGKGFSALVIARLFFYAAISLVVISLALGMLFSSLMAMGNMGELYELAALKAAGISLFRIIYPMAVIGVGICIIAFAFSFYITPYYNLKMYSLLYDAEHAKPALALKPGIFNGIIDGYTIRIQDRNNKRGMLYGVMIYDHSENRGNVKLIMADSGKMNIDNQALYLRMNLYHGTQDEEMEAENGSPNASPHARAAFDTLNYKLDMSGFGLRRTDESLFASHQYMLNVTQLAHKIDSLELKPKETITELRRYIGLTMGFHDQSIPHAVQPGGQPKVPVQNMDSLLRKKREAEAQMSEVARLDHRQQVENLALSNARGVKNYSAVTSQKLLTQAEDVRKYQIEYHLKFTYAFSCLLFLFIGAPLGAIIRKGGLGMPVIISVFFFILFYVLLTQGKKLALEAVWPVWVGVWLPVLVMIPMATYLCYQSATDSQLMDLSAWRGLGSRLQFWRPYSPTPLAKERVQKA